MEVKAEAKWVRRTPRKIRLLLPNLRGKGIDEARTYLRFSDKAAARDVLKTLNSAVANAVHNQGIDESKLRVEKAVANEGPILKRYMFGGRGRVKPLQKKTSHIVITVGENNGTKD